LKEAKPVLLRKPQERTNTSKKIIEMSTLINERHSYRMKVRAIAAKARKKSVTSRL
jgi:hypothetical protein